MTTATTNQYVYDVPSRPNHGKHDQILTVGELIGILSQCDEDDQVLIGAQCVDAEWLNVCQVLMPDDNEGICALTLIAVDTFDPRQF
jgi:hypothetical protein